MTVSLAQRVQAQMTVLRNYATDWRIRAGNVQPVHDAIALITDLEAAMTWRTMDGAPKDGKPFWGKCGDDAIRMFWHPEFNAFISSYNVMNLAKGMTFADTGLPYKLHSPEIHKPSHWMPVRQVSTGEEHG